MISWISANIGTIVVILVVAAIVGLIIRQMIKNKKVGKTNCGCGCENCSMSEICHKQ
ncbi:MAG: FeoB-associated Cys-rich membrane protein [Clostridia bacterium]|nr:FeoB-associated Cys-rich membrane protein [Clostridia bacterium]MBQ1896215.1 FeoB-associated Cys-rich membrane protein [Clostridia bacterium]MBQ2092222.1 FeoB-associated Cys-rich membrane protein [Clostridia bacterium]MBQ2500674.1 FeoB-associated Cys-rich membrane protein [Clostridia bacterium]MBQ3897828.1 FeoB-associated Cys-rich membrane protein [Clostridia bacterium]